MSRIHLVIIISAAAICCKGNPTAPATSQAALDQVAIPLTLGLGNVKSSISGSAQSFTVGISGRLTAVDVLVDGGLAGVAPSDITVEVRALSENGPAASVLASGTIPAASVTPQIEPRRYSTLDEFIAAFQHVPLQPAIAVTSGQSMAIVALTDRPFGTIYGYGIDVLPSTYVRGNAFQVNGSTWFRYDFLDWYFRTYVVPDR